MFDKIDVAYSTYYDCGFEYLFLYKPNGNKCNVRNFSCKERFYTMCRIYKKPIFAISTKNDDFISIIKKIETLFKVEKTKIRKVKDGIYLIKPSRFWKTKFRFSFFLIFLRSKYATASKNIKNIKDDRFYISAEVGFLYEMFLKGYVNSSKTLNRNITGYNNIVNIFSDEEKLARKYLSINKNIARNIKVARRKSTKSG